MTVTPIRPAPAPELLAIAGDAAEAASRSIPPGTSFEAGADLIARAVLTALCGHPETLTSLLADALSEMAAESPDRCYESVVAGSPAEPAWHLTVRALCPDRSLAATRLRAANQARIEVANEHAHEYHDRLERWLAELGVVVPQMRRSA